MKTVDNFIEWNSLISSGDLSTIQKLFDRRELSPKDKLGRYELSPLHLAAWHNQPEICEFLISQKTSPDVVESYSKKTPLHFAAYLGHRQVAELLIKLGKNIHKRKLWDIIGCHPLHCAALGENEELIFLFLSLSHLVGRFERVNFFPEQSSCIGNILDILIHKKNLALCDLISSAVGISIVETNPRKESTMYIGYINENPWTPFHSAAILGDKQILEMLLHKFPHAYSLSETFASYFDYSPGEVALVEGHEEIGRLLGEKRNIESCRRKFNHFHISEKAPAYFKELLQSIEERNFSLLDKLIVENGEKILYQNSYLESQFEYHRSFYEESSNLNAFSAIARLFCFSSSEWLKKKDIQISEEEFLNRDVKERVFFNWAMLDVHPYATGFFKQITEDINLVSRK